MLIITPGIVGLMADLKAIDRQQHYGRSGTQTTLSGALVHLQRCSRWQHTPNIRTNLIEGPPQSPGLNLSSVVTEVDCELVAKASVLLQLRHAKASWSHPSQKPRTDVGFTRLAGTGIARAITFTALSPPDRALALVVRIAGWPCRWCRLQDVGDSPSKRIGALLVVEKVELAHFPRNSHLLHARYPPHISKSFLHEDLLGNELRIHIGLQLRAFADGQTC
mmetsp:Transcript_55334/g.132127  ORF Transcript_55334/g.132127 Transcript_55334/m.132127 type:complete len:221 (-) Transcript_55334:2007-2669(-)